jgi:hypothetical protein
VNKRRLLLILALLLLVGMVFVVEDLFRDAFVIPLLYTFWVLQILFESFSQVLLWAVLIALAVIVASRSLLKRSALPPVRHTEAAQRGRVEEWARLIQLSNRSPYSRWRLAQRLSKLVADILAHEERLSPRQARQRLDAGALDLPPEVQAYLRAGIGTYNPYTNSAPRFTLSLRGRSLVFGRRSALDLDPEHVVRLLEERLKGKMGGSA